MSVMRSIVCSDPRPRRPGKRRGSSAKSEGASNGAACCCRPRPSRFPVSGERIAAIRAPKAEQRARAMVKAERKAAEEAKRTGKAPKSALASTERRPFARGPAPANSAVSTAGSP